MSLVLNRSYLLGAFFLSQAFTASSLLAATYNNSFMDSCAGGNVVVAINQKMASATSCRRVDQTTNTGNLQITCSLPQGTSGNVGTSTSGNWNTGAINTVANNNTLMSSNSNYGRNGMFGGSWGGRGGFGFGGGYRGGYGGDYQTGYANNYNNSSTSGSSNTSSVTTNYSSTGYTSTGATTNYTTTGNTTNYTTTNSNTSNTNNANFIPIYNRNGILSCS